MIPSEVSDIATLIWPEFDFDVRDDASKEVLAAAWRIYNSGYRKNTQLRTALQRIVSLGAKNVSKYAQEIAKKSLNG